MPPKKIPDLKSAENDCEKEKEQSCFDDAANQHLIRAAQVYRILSNRDQILFLQRNLSFSRRRFLNKTNTASRKRKLSFIVDGGQDLKRRKLSSIADHDSYAEEQRQADGLQIILESVDDETGLFDKIEIEASILKLNGGLTDKFDKDGVVINRLGSYEVNRNHKRRSSSSLTTLKTTLDIPADAFSPLNGHLSWCSWLILRCQLSGPKLTERILRRLGHRKSSRWLLGNPHHRQIRTAALPLCKSGETSLTSGEIELKLCPCEETDEQLLDGLRNVFSNKHRSSPTHHPFKFNDKNDARNAWIRLHINWRRNKNMNYDNIHNSINHFNNNFSSNSPPTIRLSRGINDFLLMNGLSQKISNNNHHNNNYNNHNFMNNHHENGVISKIIDNNNRLCINNGCQTAMFNHREKFIHKNNVKSCSNLHTSSSVPKSLYYRFNCFKSETNCVTCRLHSEAGNSCRCPFCNVWAEDIYFLLKHLKTSHPRFVFFYKEKVNSQSRHLIEVAVNADFENKLEILPVPRFSANFYPHRQKNKPRKWHFRLTFFWKRNKNDINNNKNQRKRRLDEFKFNGTGLFMKRPRSLNRQRQYYHSQTCAPILPGEMDVDSENEVDPDWLRITRCRLIDEFSDVNDGEKRIMKLWNLYVMKHNFFGDNQMFTACQTFLAAHSRLMVEKGGFTNFRLHLASLYKYGLLTQHQVQALSIKVKELKRKC